MSWELNSSEKLKIQFEILKSANQKLISDSKNSVAESRRLRAESQALRAENHTLREEKIIRRWVCIRSLRLGQSFWKSRLSIARHCLRV
jgi:hypothetical protein